jgi:hypothetical protein
MNNSLQRRTVLVGGRKISLLVSDVISLCKDAAIVQDMYDKVSSQYENKLDREGIFLFIIFMILDEKSLKLQDDSECIHLIHSLSRDIDMVNLN